MKWHPTFTILVICAVILIAYSSIAREPQQETQDIVYSIPAEVQCGDESTQVIVTNIAQKFQGWAGCHLIVAVSVVPDGFRLSVEMPAPVGPSTYEAVERINREDGDVYSVPLNFEVRLVSIQLLTTYGK